MLNIRRLDSLCRLATTLMISYSQYEYEKAYGSRVTYYQLPNVMFKRDLPLLSCAPCCFTSFLPKDRFNPP
jgi:hypothetical protein